MANSMDSYVSKGKSDVQDKLKEGTDSIAKIGDEFQGVKNQLQDMPGGLDVDLIAMIKDAENSGRSEVLQDIDATKSAIIDTAKSAADSIKGDVQGKMKIQLQKESWKVLTANMEKTLFHKLKAQLMLIPKREKIF